MASLQNRGGYEFDGTAALKRRNTPVLRLYEGNACASVAARPQEAHTSRSKEATPLPAESLKAALVLVGVVASLVLAGFVADGLHTSAVTAQISSMPVEEVYVYPGQTIWGIAKEHSIEGVSTQELVSWIEKSNSLSSASLTPGQELRVPVVRK